MSKKAYIFDFDGTLVDSMPAWSSKMRNVLEKNNVEYPPDIITTITPLGDIGTAKYFREKLGLELSDEQMIAMMDEYALPKYRDEIVLKDSVYDYLKLLKSKGYSLNVLTASPHKMLDPCLKRNGIDVYFDNIWSCDDFGTTKSNPEIYVKACEKIGCDVSEAAFFDDNITAVKTASSAGLFTVGVYDKSAEDFADEIISTSNIYVTSFAELMDREL